MHAPVDTAEHQHHSMMRKFQAVKVSGPGVIADTTEQAHQSRYDDSSDSCASDTDSNTSYSSIPKAESGGDTTLDSKMRSRPAVTSSSTADGNEMVSAGSSQAWSGSRSAAGDSEEPSVKRKRRPRPPMGDKQLCAVCGDAAFGYNFDAVSCESCKAFFRRNAMRQHSCQNGNLCKIDKESRKYCSSCRLAKCLQVGMKRELILTPAKLEKRAKLVRKKHVRHNSGGSTSTTAGTNSQPCPTSAVQSVATPSSSGLNKPASDSQAHTPAQAAVRTVEQASNISAATSPCSYIASAPVTASESAVKVKCERLDDSPFSSLAFAGAISGPAYAPVIASAGQHAAAASAFGAQPLFASTSPTVQDLASARPTSMTNDVLSELSNAQSEAMLAEMARLGLEMANAAAQQRRGNGAQLTVKQENDGQLGGTNQASSPNYCGLSISLPVIEYDQTLAKCAVACEQLLRPLNANDMRQLRPTNVAYEQFNYGEVFVRRFVSAFKQVSDFRSLGQVSQLKLLRSSMISTLNIGGVFSFDVSRQAWVLQVENCAERVYLVQDMIALFESSGQAHIRDYMQSYCDFHTQLRNQFGNDVILFFVLILIDMFSPHRFTADREMLALLVPAHARYVQFLELYLASNYSTKQNPPTSSTPTAQGTLGWAQTGPSGATNPVHQPGSPLEPAVKKRLDFCLNMLSNARTLEEYLAITSQFIGLTAMLPLLAEVCEQQLNETSDME